MAAAASTLDYLLAPISKERPAGEDITLAPEWSAINEARRKDKVFGRLNANWLAIRELLTAALTTKSKDLRLAVWLAEANMKMEGFAGLSAGLQLLAGLIESFWDSGLYPEIEGGDLQFRAMPLKWLGGENLPSAMREIPLTSRGGEGRDYSYFDFIQAREIGWEKDIRNSLGDIDQEKEKKRNSALAGGAVSQEMFEDAIKSTKRATVESLRADFDAAWDEFEKLDRIIDRKFGEEAPGTSEARDAFADCRSLLDEFLKRKRREEPDPASTPTPAGSGVGLPVRESGMQLPSFDLEGVEAGGSWAGAEDLARKGQIQEALAEMTRLASQQYGRVHFQHRLRLAEICLTINRQRLAIAILEELAKTIDEFKLEKWEAPELIGRVWGRLYQLYRSEEPGSTEGARGNNLFGRLCSLDPWQAYRWEE